MNESLVIKDESLYLTNETFNILNDEYIFYI